MRRISVLLLGVSAVLAGVATTPGDTTKQKDAVTDRVYRFHRNADEILALAFPRHANEAVFLKGYALGQRSQRFSSLEEVHAASVDAENLAELPPQRVSWPRDVIESPWLAVHTTNDAWSALLSSEHLDRLATLVSGIAAEDPHFSSVLEKALFQRDLLQIFVCLYRATNQATDPSLRVRGDRTLRTVGQLLHELFLTREELTQLHSLLPLALERTRYVTDLTYDLRDDYLPNRVVANDPAWYELDIEPEHLEHFQVHGGRSFIRVFLRQAGVEHSELRRLWESAFATRPGLPAERLVADWSPAGLETLLVRSFGVFLEEGVFADTGFPEEATIRAFRHVRSTLDIPSSDYRGTFQYQYKMSRRDLLADPGGLGLQRVRDDDPAAVGFLSTAPDPFHTGGATVTAVTSMRFNCINCHSTATYGVQTIFALRLPPRNSGGPRYPNPVRIRPTKREFRFLTAEMEFLLGLNRPSRSKGDLPVNSARGVIRGGD